MYCTCRECAKEDGSRGAALLYPQNKIPSINEVLRVGHPTKPTSFGGKFLAIFFLNTV